MKKLLIPFYYIKCFYDLIVIFKETKKIKRQGMTKELSPLVNDKLSMQIQRSGKSELEIMEDVNNSLEEAAYKPLDKRSKK